MAIPAVLYVSARGLTTSAIPYGDRSFQLDFDFLDHVLRASASDGGQEEIGLYPRSVADFYAEVMRSLAQLGINIRINELPNEIPDAIRFSEDRVHASYDREYAARFWRILVQSARVLGRFRTGFIGKCSPVGQLRSRRDPFLGAQGAAVHAERCRTQLAGGGRARCLLARMFERRLLARWSGCRLPGFLFLRLAITSGLRFGGYTPGAGFLEQQPEPVQSALRHGAHRRRP